MEGELRCFGTVSVSALLVAPVLSKWKIRKERGYNGQVKTDKETNWFERKNHLLIIYKILLSNLFRRTPLLVAPVLSKRKIRKKNDFFQNVHLCVWYFVNLEMLLIRMAVLYVNVNQVSSFISTLYSRGSLLRTRINRILVKLYVNNLLSPQIIVFLTFLSVN